MGLPAVTRDRVTSVLDKLEVVYHVDDDGDVVYSWDHMLLYTHFDEKALNIFGYWRGKFVTPQLKEQGRKICNKLNSNCYLPKCYLDETSEGHGIVKMEVSQWIVPGMSDAQLEDLHKLAISVAIRTCEELAQEFPDLVEWDTEED